MSLLSTRLCHLRQSYAVGQRLLPVSIQSYAFKKLHLTSVKNIRKDPTNTMTNFVAKNIFKLDILPAQDQIPIYRLRYTNAVIFSQMMCCSSVLGLASVATMMITSADVKNLTLFCILTSVYALGSYLITSNAPVRMYLTPKNTLNMVFISSLIPFRKYYKEYNLKIKESPIPIFWDIQSSENLNKYDSILIHELSVLDHKLLEIIKEESKTTKSS